MNSLYTPRLPSPAESTLYSSLLYRSNTGPIRVYISPRICEIKGATTKCCSRIFFCIYDDKFFLSMKKCSLLWAEKVPKKRKWQKQCAVSTCLDGSVLGTSWLVLHYADLLFCYDISTAELFSTCRECDSTSLMIRCYCWCCHWGTIVAVKMMTFQCYVMLSVTMTVYFVNWAI